METKDDIYNGYLNNKLEIHQLIVALDHLQEKEIKSKGVIYTPWNIVQKMVEIAHIKKTTTIVEPSCGHGIFLFGILEHARIKLKLKKEKLFQWFIDHVTGVEISDTAIYELKEILSLYFNKIGYEVSESEFVNIIHEDSLYVNFGERTPFDLCIGNPPYVRTRELEEEYLRNLRETFKSCEKGNVDIYYAFIERYTNLANELCFITPNSFIKNESAKSLRELIVDKITYLVDFKEKLVFPDARTYTCIFKLGNDISIKECLYANDIDQQVVTTSKKKIFDELDSTSHDMIDNVLSGIATLCDSAYIVKKIDGKFYASTNEETFEIEKDIVVPYLKITKQKNNDFSNIDYMIYPYHGDKSIIDEDTMQTKYAKAYAYLLAVKERLLARDKGKTERYESWYAYGRKQGLHNITENYIIAVPQMIGGACKPQQLDIANLLTEFGKVVFSSGFVIPLRSDNKLVSDYLLSQDFIDFSKKNGKPWPGKDESYYSLTAKQIRKFKV